MKENYIICAHCGGCYFSWLRASNLIFFLLTVVRGAMQEHWSATEVLLGVTYRRCNLEPSCERVWVWKWCQNILVRSILVSVNELSLRWKLREENLIVRRSAGKNCCLGTWKCMLSCCVKFSLLSTWKCSHCYWLQVSRSYLQAHIMLLIKIQLLLFGHAFLLAQ